ncbi:hypothetical protein N0V90_001718 [Kalmusia sp. IMI 367209]|nr:hypothetical protein N0V90_001718 [Kalmusia sp. IMI 367209]
MILLFGYGIISPALACKPFAYNWDKSIPGGKCIDLVAAYRWVSFPNILTDLALMALCFPSIYTVQLPLITKIGLFATFGIGSVGIVTSILRFVEFWRADIFTDYTYNGGKPLLWTLVEPGVYFLAATLLQMNPLFAWMFKSVTFPKALIKFTSNLSKKSTKNSSATTGISKETGIELKYSDSTKELTLPSPILSRDGFSRLSGDQEVSLYNIPR